MAGRGVARDALLVALALAAAVAAHRPFLALGHLGWDTYPLILTSRIASPADFVSGFAEELMDGRYPHGRFYRPVTSLSFALDHAAWGLAPWGYHLTQLGLLLACTLAVAVLARRLLGPGLPAPIAAWLFALHPLHVETLPVGARRADGLALLFSLLALCAAPEPGARPRTARAWLCALCAALAIASKESGVVVLPLLFALHFGANDAATPRARVREALRACAPPALAVGLVLLVRTAVLGGIGGNAESSLLAGTGRGVALAPRYARLLAMPQPLASAPALAQALLAASAALLAAALWLCRAGASRRTLLLCGIWALVALWLNGVATDVASWYAMALLPAYALLVASVARAASACAASGRRARAAFGACVATLLVAEALAYTSLFHDYTQWTLVSERSQDFLERVREAANGAAPGDVRSVPGLPLGLATPLERVGVRSAIGLADYSVEAWAELALPGPKLAVVIVEDGMRSPPRRDAIVIDTTPDAAEGAVR